MGTSAHQEVLVVGLDDWRIAFGLTCLSELQRAVAEEPLAGAPDAVTGLVNLRGRAVPHVDLRRRLGLPSRDAVPADLLLFLHVGDRLVATRVDRAERIVSLSPDAVTDVRAPVHGTTTGHRVAAVSDGLLVIFDVEGLFTAEELTGLDEALAAVAGEPAS